MYIATWNVNSLRVRLPQVQNWFIAQNPTIPTLLALQETKLQNHDFPVADFENAGLIYAFHGQKTYNGVALLANCGFFSDIETSFPYFEDPQARMISATWHFEDQKIRVVNIYVPNGQSLDSDKYGYKLDWLAALRGYLTETLRTYQDVVVLGDFNIVPRAEDSFDPNFWENGIFCSPAERNLLQQIIHIGLSDTLSRFNKSPIFTWWDYRQSAYRRNLGLRIDHILLTKNLEESCKNCFVDKPMRALTQPSDHAPVVAAW